MPLTDTAIRAAKAGEKRRKISDGGGLQLWLMPSGAKLWRLMYRFDGHQKKLALGAYPTTSLKDARAARDRAKEVIASGRDPGEVKKVEKATRAIAQANTFEAIAEELIAKKEREGISESTIAKTRWLLSFATPTIGSRPISEITAAEALVALRGVEQRGRLESARRLRSVIGEVFRYAIATARAENDPTFALRGALTTPTVKHRAAILEPKAVGALMRAIDGFDGQPVTRAALQLMAICFPRPGELRAALWRDVDLEAAVWTLPAAVTKMRREHCIPLPAQAVAIFKALKPLTGHGRAGLVFPGTRTVDRCISENTMNAALRRLGYGPDEATPHGFRATASTLLNQSGKWAPDVIERALAHAEEDDVRAAYNRAEHWDERVKMADWWANELDRLRDGAEIVKFPKSAG